ncbi:MAG: type II toxin-antitoxin system PemK/MazF family toxin [Proteobacteria bacterium]|nr:type II toxin-antitoxin system PemK/MazF family toxin [Pseudomonadota bacterium]
MSRSTNDQFEEGEVVLVSLDPAIGSEQKKTRSCVILEGRNHPLGLCLLVPITDGDKKKSPLFIPIINLDKAGLIKPSVIDTYQIRAIDKSRIKERKGFIDEETLDKVLVAIRYVIGIESKHLK